MTPDQMPAGPEMDLLVATGPMEWDLGDRGFYSMRSGGPEMYRSHHAGRWEWRPSTNIAHAWEVAEAKWISVIRLRDGKFMAGVFDPESMGYIDAGGVVDDCMSPYAVADSAPLAICRAALKAVGAK